MGLLMFLGIMLIVSATSSRPAQPKGASTPFETAKERLAREKAERREKYPYGDDMMGKYLSYLDRDSNGGAQVYLDSIPAEKTRTTMKLGGRTYNCITWSEGGKGE